VTVRTASKWAEFHAPTNVFRENHEVFGSRAIRPAKGIFRGLRGQYVLVDPALKLVLVQTALVGGQQEFAELLALWNALRAQFQ